MQTKKQDDSRPAGILTVRIASSSSEVACFICGEICSADRLSECSHLEFVTISPDPTCDRCTYVFQFRYEGKENSAGGATAT